MIVDVFFSMLQILQQRSGEEFGVVAGISGEAFVVSVEKKPK